MIHAESRARNKRAVSLVKGGTSIAEASQLTGLDIARLQKCCRAAGVKYTRKTTVCVAKSNRTLNVLADLIRNKMSQSAIGRKYHITHQAVSDLRKRAIAAGIPLAQKVK